VNRAAIRAGNNWLQDVSPKLSTGVPMLLSCQTAKNGESETEIILFWW
jgi:hypothetical protein